MRRARSIVVKPSRHLLRVVQVRGRRSKTLRNRRREWTRGWYKVLAVRGSRGRNGIVSIAIIVVLRLVLPDIFERRSMADKRHTPSHRRNNAVSTARRHAGQGRTVGVILVVARPVTPLKRR